MLSPTFLLIKLNNIWYVIIGFCRIQENHLRRSRSKNIHSKVERKGRVLNWGGHSKGGHLSRKGNKL